MTDTWAIDGYWKARYNKLSPVQKMIRDSYLRGLRADAGNTLSLLGALTPHEPYDSESKFIEDDVWDKEKQYWADQWDLARLDSPGLISDLMDLHCNDKGECGECSDFDSRRDWPCTTAKLLMHHDETDTPKWEFPKRRLKPVGTGTVTFEIK